MSKTKLIISALTKYIAGLLMVGLMLFLPAGTLHYFNGWLFIALLLRIAGRRLFRVFRGM